MGVLEEIIKNGEATPIAKVNGRNVYTFSDAVRVNNKERAEEIYEGKVDFGNREVREGGLCYTRTQCHTVAVNPDNYYLNRYRKKKEGTKMIYEVVSDYRAIKEQSTGRVYTNNIVVDMVENSKDGLKYIGRKNISDTEFINEFKNNLNNVSFQKIASVILESVEGQATGQGDSLDF